MKKKRIEYYQGDGSKLFQKKYLLKLKKLYMLMPMKITKKVEFDYGHRVPNHKSKCRNIHGHRGVVEITLKGGVVEKKGVSDEGMVMDFSDIKRIANDFIDRELDHGFICYKDDYVVMDFFNQGNPATDSFKLYVVDFIPTAENLAKHIFEVLNPRYKSTFGNSLELYRIRFWETPNSYADYTNE